MPAGYKDIEFERGSRFTWALTWYDADRAPINLTGYSAKMQIRHRSGAATLLLELSTAAGSISLGGALGTITFNANIDALPAGVHEYDLILTTGGGIPKRLLEGKASMSLGVTV
jgi:hypothetical protein